MLFSLLGRPSGLAVRMKGFVPHPRWGTGIVVANVMWLSTWLGGYYDVGDCLDAPSMLRKGRGSTAQASELEEVRPRFPGCVGSLPIDAGRMQDTPEQISA